MSFKGVVELVLHIDSYFIVEYPHQGLFSFNCSIYQLKEGKKIYAIPYQIMPNINPQPQERFSRLIVEPRIHDQRAFSSVALAKYSDEQIAIDNWFCFRLQLQAYPQLESDDIFMDIEFRLNHKDLSEPELPGNDIQTVKFRLNDIENGFFNYVEAHFTTPYLSKLNMALLGYISSFKFTKYQALSKQPTKQQKKRMSITTVQQLVEFAKIKIKNTTVQSVFYNNYVKKLRISQYLIKQKVNCLSINPRQFEIDLCQDFISKIQCEKITAKEFKQYLDNYVPQNLTIDYILKEINYIREQNFDLLQRVIKSWMQGEFDCQKMVNQFETFGKEKYGEMVFKSTVIANGDKLSQVSYHENKKVANQMRRKNVIVNSYPIEDIRFEEKKQQQQLIFYEITQPFQNKEQQQQGLQLTPFERSLQLEGSKYQYNEKHMLVVLCHGYQGTSYDMMLIKRWIKDLLPDAYYLISRCNEDDTDGDIRHMGQKLAEEIQKFIINYMEDEYQQENVIINMVGHSMGGIIARAAIPHLSKYHKQMGFFCSLSSPHLGYLNGVSGLIKVGLWAIRKFKNIQSLEQLSMQERGDPRKTFLYELSRTGHLRYFRKIILLCSYEDSYVSWHSARISPHRSKNSSSKIEQEMVSNILENNIYGASIHRLDINFNVKQKNLDSFIGRTAHINLIIRENMFKTLQLTIPKLFELTQFGREGMFL